MPNMVNHWSRAFFTWIGTDIRNVIGSTRCVLQVHTSHLIWWLLLLQTWQYSSLKFFSDHSLIWQWNSCKRLLAICSFNIQWKSRALHVNARSQWNFANKYSLPQLSSVFKSQTYTTTVHEEEWCSSFCPLGVWVLTMLFSIYRQNQRNANTAQSSLYKTHPRLSRLNVNSHARPLNFQI